MINHTDPGSDQNDAGDGIVSDKMVPPHAWKKSMTDRRLLLVMLMTVGLVSGLVFALSPVIMNFDSFPAIPTAISILNRHTLALNYYSHVPFVAKNYTIGQYHGTALTQFPWVVALFALPTVAMLDAVHLVGGPTADHVVSQLGTENTLTVIWTASLVTALACTVMAALAYRRLGGSARTRRRLALVCGLVFAFGTSAWSTASRALWQHGPSLLMLGVGLLAMDRIFPAHGIAPTATVRRAALLAGASFALAFAIRPVNAIALGLMLLAIAWRMRQCIWTYVVGAAAVLLPWMAVTHAFYGVYIQPYDSASRLTITNTFLEALAANLVSPARGILIFSPVVALAGWGAILVIRQRSAGPIELVSIVILPLYLIVVSMFPEWWAGSSYGPRFMSESLPFLLILSLPAIDRLREWSADPIKRKSPSFTVAVVLVLLLVMASIVINGEGGMLRATTCWNAKEGSPLNIDNRPSRVWSWSDAQFDYGLRALSSEGMKAVTTCPASP